MALFSWFRRKRAVAPQTPRPTARPYYVLGGRRMRIDHPYMLPKDLEESNRLELQHHMLKLLLRGNYLAPLRQPASILDVGCGTGRWGAEMAQQFPQANVIGLDIQPPAASSTAVTMGKREAPDNYIFVEGDVTKGLPFADASFDFVHMRLVVLALPKTAWMPAITELKRVTRPGGWIELVDTSVTERVPASHRWVEWAYTLAQYRNIDMTAGSRVGEFLTAAGLRTIKTQTLEVPLGNWGGRIGALMAADAVAGARALEVPVSMAHLATKEEFDAVVTKMGEEFNAIVGCTQPFYIAYGQR